MWKIVAAVDLYLPQRYRVPRENFKSVVYGVTLKPLWEECVSEVRKRLPLPLSAEYSNSLNRQERHHQVHHLIAALKVSIEEIVMNASWMDEQARLAALRKLENIRFHMGSAAEAPVPDVGLNKLNLRRDSYFDNALQLMRISAQSDFSVLENSTEPNSRPSAFMITPPSVDAFYDYYSNELVFTDAMLSYPLIGEKLPQSAYFGALGMALAHEMMHSVDDLGSNYGENGTFEPWWSEELKEVYDQKRECFVAQYSSKSQPDTGRYLDGKLTANENIADNAGIRVAYNAFKSISKQNGNSSDRFLPSFSNYTDHQMFFLAFANMFCEVVKPGSMDQVLNTDSHSLGPYRVNVPLQNFPEFSKTFKCPIGSPMNPYEKCKLW
ncbi:hypothetical protein L596_003221 [Steinernema carpocapsae]|uniref:Peptidase M13 C-terminal domain-containing protein n=1 Tax=Steinernema carpocapsae TaxID=34508 RepID=A0A4U8USJ9_STECR|nr:hypothetical protein L596_003221 [Steinernema carpocapsae]